MSCCMSLNDVYEPYGAVTGSTAPSGGSCTKTLPANPIVNNANAITDLMMNGISPRLSRSRPKLLDGSGDLGDYPENLIPSLFSQFRAVRHNRINFNVIPIARLKIACIPSTAITFPTAP